MKHTVRRQTIKHFIHTFMKDYDTEKAADKTMKSKYVPTNLKTQLVAAMSQCDPSDNRRIERVARLGMFIDTSCNELIYYNTITTAIMRWTVSLYIDSTEIKHIFEVIMEDVGRICDEDVQFIMEKYRYLEETDALTAGESNECSLMSFLRPRKHSPDMSLIRYYGHSLWLKVLRAVLRNSINMFDSNSFSSVFTGLLNSGSDDNLNNGGDNDEVAAGLSSESRALYKEFRENRTQWLKAVARSNRKKIENAATNGYYSNSGSDEEDHNNYILRPNPPRPPPDVTLTAFDVRFDDNYEDGDDESDNSCRSDLETVLEAPYTYKRKSEDQKRGQDLGKKSINNALGWHDGTNQQTALCQNGVEPVRNNSVVATVTQEKKLHILDSELNDLVLEEKRSKSLSSNNQSSAVTTTVKTTVTKRRRRKRRRQGQPDVVSLELLDDIPPSHYQHQTSGDEEDNVRQVPPRVMDNMALFFDPIESIPTRLSITGVAS